jgi:formylglycine-generating enzyme required for sulfatase activity
MELGWERRRRRTVAALLALGLLVGGASAVAVVGASGRAQPQDASAEMQPYSEPIAGSQVSFEMVPIPGGVLTMGSAPSEAGRAADEGPQHRVTIRPFWIGVHEVTWDEYDLFALAVPRKVKGALPPPADADATTHPTTPFTDESFGYGKGRQPAISMTHHAAMEYCRWLSQKTGKAYRLPTEAEWEYASRAGTSTPYSFPEGRQALGEFAWFEENAESRPHPVGQRKPNPWGLFDVHGNVAEWCLDEYRRDAYKLFVEDPPVVGPVLLPGATRYPHVVRGGSWRDSAAKLRSAARMRSAESWNQDATHYTPSIWWHNDAPFVGFRVVRAFEEQDELKGFRSRITKESP